MPMPPVGPKLTVRELEEMTGLTAKDGRKYHGPLPHSWDNAEWVANNPGSNPEWPYGHQQNRKLKEAIVKAFLEVKGIQDPKNSPWLLAWRMYPNKDHPLWQQGMPECGCNCGCFAPKP